MSGHECDDALTNLYQYLDREIEASTSEVIRAHLEDCSGCLKSFDFEARLQIVVRERLAEDVPDEFVQRLRDAIAREAASS
ncbi:MAG TPA: mycothiol system anti-sigma-R factor [Acidimicrobiia bacterium]|jgi:anti-sigma factor (TIGR02949 family)|nr:mycothiol system anti-sigma-R factor [Acidimicrobiia bacterium]